MSHYDEVTSRNTSTKAASDKWWQYKSPLSHSTSDHDSDALRKVRTHDDAMNAATATTASEKHDTSDATKANERNGGRNKRAMAL